MIHILNINVDELQEVTPQIEVRARATMRVKVVITNDQLKELFNQIWVNVGDEGIEELFHAEGYTLVKNDDEKMKK